MRSLLETEEEEETKQAEITLSTASLLGIFFGLVLVCGVFFGFGYSMGRGTPTHSNSASAAPPVNEDEPTPAPPAATTKNETEPQPAPEASAPPAEDKAAEQDSAPAATSVPAQQETPAPQIHPARPPAGKPMPATPMLVQQPMLAPAVPAGQAMVQIAAVARREDADVLVNALRQRGYGVVVRVEPQDNLLHVQVGPFADRGQAAAMRQKLLSDGYNAIIKQ
jgi:DedD protein